MGTVKKKRIAFTPSPQLSLAATLRSLRQLHGWTQRQLCLEAGVSQTTISFIEKGRAEKVRAETLTRLAQALAVSPDTLLGRVRRAGPPPVADDLVMNQLRDLMHGLDAETRLAILEQIKGFVAYVRRAEKRQGE